MYTDAAYFLDDDRAVRARRMIEYKNFLIENILEWAGERFTREELKKRSIAVLERIHDNC